MQTLGLYVHIPFCRQKCGYCDFPSRAGGEALHAAYTEAVLQEIAWQGKRLGRPPVDTLFFGGGTPTVLGAAMLEKLLLALQQHFEVLPGAEASLEANPGTVTLADLQRLRAAGFNRLSLGVQSFDDVVLRRCGRIHSGAEAAAALEAAAQAGFANRSVDLMTGLPLQTLAVLQRSVRAAVAAAVTHLSVYALKVEAGTPFAREAQADALELPDEEETEAMDDWLESWLPEAGYGRYEISNYARPRFACRHNLRYWRYRPYLGLGAAAHSFLEGERREGVFPLEKYLSLTAAGRWQAGATVPLTQAQRQGEFCFLALRTKGGISHQSFARTFGCEFTACYRRELAQLAAVGLVTSEKGHTRLTPLGLRFGNRAFAAFLADEV